jgi:predicted nucleic acid-binding protein
VIVLDASVLADLILGTDRASRFRPYAEADPHWIAPEHFTVEVVSSLRGAMLAGMLTSAEFFEAVARLGQTPIEIWPTRPLLPRIAELAPNATAYDAAYLALAETLDVALLTGDARLSRTPGVRCTFLGIGAG